MVLIGVHDGNFHTDEIFAVAILQLIYKQKCKVVRSRDENKLKNCNLRVDVGRKYNPRNGDFDHHQVSFKEKRKNGIAYASAGLIWKHFGKKLVKKDTEFRMIDEILFQYIDAIDTGTYDFSQTLPRAYTIHNLIESYKPDWTASPSQWDKCFFEAVGFARLILQKEISRAQAITQGKEIVARAISKQKGEILELPSGSLPWKNIVVEQTKAKLVIYPRMDKTWCAEAVPTEAFKFSYRMLFPEVWAGRTQKELEKISGVLGALFCHKSRFLIAAKSKNILLELVKKAI